MSTSNFVETINGVGMRHVVADLIASIKGTEDVSVQRWKYAREHIATLFEDACIGQLVNTDPHSYVRHATRSSYENYKTLSRVVSLTHGPLENSDLKNVSKILKSVTAPTLLKKKERDQLLKILIALEVYLRGMKPRLSTHTR